MFEFGTNLSQSINCLHLSSMTFVGSWCANPLVRILLFFQFWYPRLKNSLFGQIYPNQLDQIPQTPQSIDNAYQG